MPTPRYRYILGGIVDIHAPMHHFRLIAGNSIKPDYHGKTAIRFQLPEDMELTKYSCDSYSTTEDTRTLSQIGYDVLGYHALKKRWIVINDYKGIQPHAIILDRDPRFKMTHDEYLCYYTSDIAP